MEVDLTGITEENAQERCISRPGTRSSAIVGFEWLQDAKNDDRARIIGGEIDIR